MVRLIVLFLLIVLSYGCQSPQQPASTTAQADSLYNQLQLQLDPLLQQHRFALAHALLDSLRPVGEQAKSPLILGNWLRAKGVTFLYDNQYDSARAVLHKAHQQAIQIAPPGILLARVQSTIMDCLARQQHYDSALVYGLNAYRLARQLSAELTGEIATDLSQVYGRMNDTALSRKYLFEAYSLVKDPITRVQLTNNIAAYYVKRNLMDSAIWFNEVADRDSLAVKDIAHKAARRANLGAMFIMKGQTDVGTRFLKEALALNHANHTPDEKLYMNLAQVYAWEGDFKRSNALLDTTVAIARHHGNHFFLSEAFLHLSDNQWDQHQYKQAYDQLDSAYHYHMIQDSIAYLQKAKELETQYEVRFKDEEIRRLGLVASLNAQKARQQWLLLIVIIGAVLLLSTIGLLVWRRRQAQLQLRDMQMRQQLLRTQMEPHFLFNALAVVQSFIRNQLWSQAVDYLSRLGKLLRLSLENAQHSLVSLKDEIAALESYLSLQRLASEDRFNYTLQIYENYEQDPVYIPPMLLQPFVENAVQHGVAHVNNGLISVQVSKSPENRLVCLIEDNGPGLSEPSRQQTPRSRSSSITEERLSILGRQTGNKGRLLISDRRVNEPGSGVRVEIDIPYQSSI